MWLTRESGSNTALGHHSWLADARKWQSVGPSKSMPILAWARRACCRRGFLAEEWAIRLDWNVWFRRGICRVRKTTGTMNWIISVFKMNSGKQSKRDTTESTNLVKAKPSWKRTGSDKDQTDLTADRFKSWRRYGLERWIETSEGTFLPDRDVAHYIWITLF
jgi:hypothetical protein